MTATVFHAAYELFVGRTGSAGRSSRNRNRCGEKVFGAPQNPRLDLGARQAQPSRDPPAYVLFCASWATARKTQQRLVDPRGYSDKRVTAPGILNLHPG